MDGTTATTLAPSEEEMRGVAETFARMRDAVIDASKLASEVAELRNAVGSLRNELESLRSTNRWMDGQITELRKQRDEEVELSTNLNRELTSTRNDRDSLQVHCDNQRETLARLNAQVAQLHTENDAWLAEVDKLSKERDEALAKLDTIVDLVCPPKVVETSPVVVEHPRDPETQQFKSWDDSPARDY